MKDAFVILGMHRSGTSSVAGTLAKLGAAAPLTLMPPVYPDNPKGYWESEAVMRINDRILTAAGSSWSDWRAVDPSWRETDEGRALEAELSPLLTAEFGEAPVVVLKDPRICRLYPAWRDALTRTGYTPRVVMPIRSPLEVAASLNKRNAFGQARALMIWLRHVLEAEVESRGASRAVVSWTDFLDDWRGQTERLRRMLDVPLQPLSPEMEAEIDAYLDGDLRRNVDDSAVPADLPDWFSMTLSALRRMIDAPEDARAMADIDAVKAEFDRTGGVYGQAMAGLEQEVADRDALRHKLAFAVQQRDAAQERLAEVEDQLARANAEVARLLAPTTLDA